MWGGSVEGWRSGTSVVGNTGPRLIISDPKSPGVSRNSGPFPPFPSSAIFEFAFSIFQLTIAFFYSSIVDLMIMFRFRNKKDFLITYLFIYIFGKYNFRARIKSTFLYYQVVDDEQFLTIKNYAVLKLTSTLQYNLYI